jgi:hypothetical protein
MNLRLYYLLVLILFLCAGERAIAAATKPDAVPTASTAGLRERRGEPQQCVPRRLECLADQHVPVITR